LGKLIEFDPETFSSDVCELERIVGKYRSMNLPSLHGTRASPKVSAIVATLMGERKSDKNLKALVCVDARSMVYIIADHLKRSGFQTFMSSCDLTGEVCQRNVQEFKNAAQPAVLISTSLISDSAYDLSCASMIVLESPWWHPARIKGCVARVANASQKRSSIKVFHIHAAGTIDDRVERNSEVHRDSVGVKWPQIIRPAVAVA
ncbi:hypothetical protein EC988_003266, partial [Linderina pennispora]